MSVESGHSVGKSGARISSLLTPATLQDERSHVLIVGPALTGKLAIGFEVLAAVAGESGAICVSTTEPVDRIRAGYDGAGGAVDGLRIVDATASESDDDADRVFSVSTPGDLTGVGIAIAEATDSIDDGVPPVLIDSLSTLLMYNDVETVYRFADSVRSQTRDGAGVTISTLNTDALGETERSRLLTLASVVVEVRVDDQGRREFQIRTDDEESSEWHAAPGHE
ncbi:MAG: hypothetical protein ABEJ86_06900 [Halococcoides sp.]